jgi:NAD(P)-dependent dehydrogenase (short-subunit alcohol dehydrogenase family)
MALAGGNFEGRPATCRPLPTALASISNDLEQFRGNSVRLKNKVALITGAGRDIALAYAREGARVVINDIDPATCDATAKDVSGLAVVADVAKSTDVARLIAAALEKYGRIDILVNNAMKIVPGKLEALPEAAWDTTMNIGLKGAFLVSQAAAKPMIAQKAGAIVNIASIAGLFPYNWAGAYSVVKAGLIMLTKLQAMEWAPTASAPTPSRPAISARPAPRRCMPIRKSTKAAARACRWAASARARTSPGRRFFWPPTTRATRRAAWSAPTAGRRWDIF